MGTECNMKSIEKHMENLKTIDRKLAMRQKENPFLHTLGVLGLGILCLFMQCLAAERKIQCPEISCRSPIRPSGSFT